jgi:outer membrane protein
LLDAAQDVIAAYEAEVEASQLALDSVRKELDVGTRTTLDLLDAQRDLLSAQVSLATSRHDRAVAALQLLAATGQLKLDAIE